MTLAASKFFGDMGGGQLMRRLRTLQICAPWMLDTFRKPSTLPELPTELIWEIASYFDAIEDYGSLLQVNYRLSCVLSQEILDVAVKRHKNPIVRFSVAAALGNEKTLRLMMKKGPMIVFNGEDEKLHSAPGEYTDDVIRKIVGIGSNLRLRCHRYRFSMRGKAPTAAEWAIERGDHMALKLLLARGANMAVRDSQGRNLLHRASTKKSYLTVAMLIEAGFDVNAKDDIQRNTPLHYAMEAGNEVALWLLLAKGADTGVRNRYFRTPMDHSFRLRGFVSERFSEMAQQILRSAIVLGSRCESQRWSSHLFDHIARTRESQGYFELIDKEFLDMYGKTWLHRAIQTYRGDLAVLIMNKGARINNKDISSRTPLSHAAERQNGEIFRFLLDRGAKIPDASNGSLLIFCERWLLDAVRGGELREVKLLLGIGINVNCPGQGIHPCTALHEAIRSERIGIAALGRKIEILKLLLEAGARIDALDCHGRTPLHAALSLSAYPEVVEMAEVLITNGASLNVRDAYGRTALHLAANNWCCCSGTIKLLLQRGADIATRDNNGDTVLHYALRSHFGILPMRFESTSGWCCRCPTPGKPNFLAYLELIVEPMINQGIGINSRSKSGKTPLHLMVENWPVKSLAKALKFVLEKGADATARDAFGNTALHLLARRNGTRGALAKILIANGININCQNSEGMDSLHIAANSGNIGIVYFLLHSGANIDETNAELPKWLKQISTGSMA